MVKIKNRYQYSPIQLASPELDNPKIDKPTEPQVVAQAVAQLVKPGPAQQIAEEVPMIENRFEVHKDLLDDLFFLIIISSI